MFRPLVMDFPNDAAAKAATDASRAFMFGPSLLVAPVLRPIFAKEDPIPGVVPETAFAGGVKVTYFRGKNFEEKVSETVDRKIDYSWPGPPLIEWPKGLTNGNDFSVKAEGVLFAPEEGEYRIGLAGDDGFRLYLDGKKVVEDWRATSERCGLVRVQLKRGEKLPFAAEYYQAGGDRSFKMVWVKPSEIAEYDRKAARVDNIEKVTLPKACGWFDFWTGAYHQGGETVAVACPMDRFPLFVKAGSLLPLGPDREWTGQQVDGPIELRVYAGADAAFTLYDDDGETYGCERGEYRAIQLKWNDAGKKLEIGQRTGNGYRGMTEKLDLKVNIRYPDGTTETRRCQVVDLGK